MEEEAEAIEQTEAAPEEAPQEAAPTSEVPHEQPPKPKKPHYGGRKANPDKEDLTEKTECGDCNKTISKHAAKYTHRCPAKKKTEVVVETLQEQPPHSSEPTPPKRAPKAEPAIQRRLLDLDNPIDYNDPHVHHVVSSYMRGIKEQQNIAKRERYRSMLSGRI